VKTILPEAWEALIEGKVRGGRYADESDVMRVALRALEWREDGDSV
jgi:putative addiction module CopG family antidote